MTSPSIFTARPRIPAVLARALVPLFGVLVVVRGHVADWDFRNYHWYNAYAWLTGRGDIDVAVAHHATYYNPLADVPVFALAQLLPAWSVGFLVGCLHGLNLLLLYRLAGATLGARPGSGADWLALASAVAGTTGGMALLLAGNASNDMTVSLFVLLSLLLIVRSFTAPPARALMYFGVAGFATGAAIGLKLTMAPFAIGLTIGTLVLHGSARSRLQGLAVLGACGIAGAALLGGAWSYRLWLETGNPFFPYFNDVIGSPLLLDASYRDPRFLPRSMMEALAYPFLFTRDGTRVSDVPFRDLKIALAYVIIPVTLLRVLASRRAKVTQVMRFLFAVSSVSYVVWLALFGIYRYVLTLEMLSPLLIALAVTLWPASERHRWGVLAALWGLALLGTGWSSITATGRSWQGGYVAVTVPAIADPAHTLAVMAGVEPMGYIVPSFPRQIAFLRIDGWLDSPTSHSRFGDRMRAQITAHDGPIYSVFGSRERQRALAAFEADGLVLAPEACAVIRSNIGQPLNWCALHRVPLSRVR